MKSRFTLPDREYEELEPEGYRYLPPTPWEEPGYLAPEPVAKLSWASKPIPEAEWLELRKMLATYRGFWLYGWYPLARTAKFLDVHQYHLRQAMTEGRAEYEMIDGEPQFSGEMIADYLLVKMGHVPDLSGR
jgi:hypothetical protein